MMAGKGQLTRNAFISHQKLLPHAEEFFAKVAAKQPLTGGGILSITTVVGGLPYSFSQSDFVHLDKLAEQAILLLGPSAGRRDDIRWRGQEFIKVAISKKMSASDAARTFLGDLFDRAMTTTTYIAANYLLFLHEDIPGLQIGPVRAMNADHVVEAFPTLDDDAKTTLRSGEAFFLSKSNLDKLGSPLNCWVVDVAGAAETSEEEINWTIQVAISLLRLHLNKNSHRKSTTGKAEARPLKPVDTTSLVHPIRGRHIGAVGRSHLATYKLAPREISEIDTPVFQKRARLIFSASKGQLAERLGRGLGWMSRARQASDAPERIVFFFTAIEALLSGEKGAAVVQTISRHASTILTNDIRERITLIKEIKKLYDYRSSLIHAGDRSMSIPDPDRVEILCEAIFRRVLENCDLQISHQDFTEQLSETSHGLFWPPAADGRPAPLPPC